MTSIVEIVTGKNHKLIDDQITVFIAWGVKNGQTKSSYKGWLDLLARHTQRFDAWDITKEDTDSYLEYVSIKYSGQYHYMEAGIAVRAFLRFYQARGKKNHSRFKSGRPSKTIKYVF